jgi:hypothetical protein
MNKSEQVNCNHEAISTQGSSPGRHLTGIVGHLTPETQIHVPDKTGMTKATNCETK